MSNMTAVWVAHVFIVPGSHLSLFGTGDQKVADRFPSSILKLSEAREACMRIHQSNTEVPHLTTYVYYIMSLILNT